MIEDFARRHRQRLYAKRDRRILSNNKYFKQIKLGRFWSGNVVLASKRCMAGSKAAHVVFDSDAWRQALVQPAHSTMDRIYSVLP